MTRKASPRWGYRTSGCVALELLDEENFKDLEYVLKSDLTEDNRTSINRAIMSFFEYHKMLDNPVRLRESKAACKAIMKSAPELIHVLQSLDSCTEDRLCNISPESNTNVRKFFSESDLIVDGLLSVLRAAELLFESPTTSKDRHRPLALSSLWNFIDELKPIYENATGKKATVTSVHLTPFVKFVVKCVELVFGEVLPETFEDQKLIEDNEYLSLQEEEEAAPVSEISMEYSIGSVNSTVGKVIGCINETENIDKSLDGEALINEKLKIVKKYRRK